MDFASAMELTATGVRRQHNSLVYACPSNPTQHVVFFQGDAQNLGDQMATIEETAPWKQWCLEHTCTLLQRKFPTSAVWIVRPSRMLRNLFSCYPNFVQSSLIGVPTYNPTYGCLPQLEGLLKDAVQRVIRNGELDMEVRNALKLPVILIGFSKGCVVLNQIIHELVNYLIPDSSKSQLNVYGHSLYRSRQLNYSQSTPSIPSGDSSTVLRTRRSGDGIGHVGHHQRSLPSSPSMPRCERLSNTEVFPDSVKSFSRSKRLASPETTHRIKKGSGSENSRSSLGERLNSSGIPHGMDQPLNSDQTPYDDRLSNSSQEKLDSPEIQHRNNLSRSGSSLHNRPLVVQHLNEILASNEPATGNERLVPSDNQDRIPSETSRSRLSSTSSTKSERGYTSECDSAFPVFRSSSFGAPASKHIIALSENAIRSLTEFLRHIKAFYWLDAGHSGGHGAWITDSELLNMLASLGSEIHVHVTPQQICDPHRLWIGEEEKDFVEKLRAFGATVFEKVHFENEERSIEMHFRVLDEF